MYFFHTSSGVSSASWLMAISKIAEARAFSSRYSSNSAYITHTSHRDGKHSKNFWYSARQRSKFIRRNSRSM